jgi:polysaccharide export outer membrane protein
LLLLTLSVLPAFAAGKKTIPDKTQLPPTPDAAVYTIGSGDVLQVSVWKETELGQKLAVRPDGMISVPLIGDLQASGETAEQLSKDIADKLKAYLTNPKVTVTVLEVHSKYFVIMGEVAKPGMYPLARPMSVLEAISQAGGFKDFAKTGKIYILHNENGNTTRTPFRYKQVVQGRIPDPGLRYGDTIVVP